MQKRKYNRYCIKCVIPDTRPHIEFDRRVFVAHARRLRKEDDIDWERENDLIQLFNKFRKNEPGTYDCIVPVGRGKDSIYQVHVVKNLYDLNPLCITFRLYPVQREENLQALRNMGVDHMTSHLIQSQLTNY